MTLPQCKEDYNTFFLFFFSCHKCVFCNQRLVYAGLILIFNCANFNSVLALYLILFHTTKECCISGLYKSHSVSTFSIAFTNFTFYSYSHLKLQSSAQALARPGCGSIIVTAPTQLNSWVWRENDFTPPP